MKNKLLKTYLKISEAIKDKRGNGAVDQTVAIGITLVLSVIVVGALIAIFNSDIKSGLTEKIKELFEQSGT